MWFCVYLKAFFYALFKTGRFLLKSSDKELWYLDEDPLFGPFQDAKWPSSEFKG